jgi:hypothetical protein
MQRICISCFPRLGSKAPDLSVLTAFWRTASLATNLRTLGVDIKIAQELMRHASCRTTLDIYTHGVSQQRRETNSKVVEMMLPSEVKKLQHPSAPSGGLATAEQCRQIHHNKWFIGGLISTEWAV